MKATAVTQTRRALLRALAAAGAAAALSRSALGLCGAKGGPTASAALAMACCAERWIAQTRIPTAHGVTWAAVPNQPGDNETNLYSGTVGIVLFYAELYAATGEKAYLHEALAGADDIAARNDDLREPQSCGLYVGLGGHIFVFAELSKRSGAERYAALAQDYVGRLRDQARIAGAGVEWNEYTDIIAGNAGIGLVLLYARRFWNDTRALPLARQAGLRLMQLGVPAHGGLRWEMNSGFPRYMPNFSHGTSGVGYFLAELYQATGERQFLDGALAAARHVVAIANTDHGLCRIMHDNLHPDLYYLGWCHGPVGTTRLFYRLGQITKDPVWDEWLKRSAQTVMQSGIPEHRTEGFWNNVSACCGDSAVLQFVLDLYNAYGDKQYLRFSRHMLEDLFRRRTEEAGSCKWVQAETRTDPGNVLAQTGYMQGAAGIGAALLRVDGDARGLKHVVFPDSPFPDSSRSRSV